MSLQFGRWHFGNLAVDSDYLGKVNRALAAYRTDNEASYSAKGIHILYRGFHTTPESHSEVQPHILASGTVLTWDGRLDNRQQVIDDLQLTLKPTDPDVMIAAAAYEVSGVRCFGRLIGDWALSVWESDHRRLILATDFSGIRHLYYLIAAEHVVWSSVLEPIIQFENRSFEVSEEYVAGWISSIYPPPHLTPYEGVYAVPPSSFVVVQPGGHEVAKHWTFGSKKITYRNPLEYEEHFRVLFCQAVQRRLRSDRPVLGELSGGLDSSSIVCIADSLIRTSGDKFPRLDTVSWYDRFNPNWGEPYNIELVERLRNHPGYHIDFQEDLEGNATPASGLDSGKSQLAATPALNQKRSKEFLRYEALINSRGYRVILSGIGGEEATAGGVPTPYPELQELIVTGQFLRVIHRLNAWASRMGKHPFPLLWQTLWLLLSGMPRDPERRRALIWLNSRFAQRNRAALLGHRFRTRLFGSSASLQHHLCGLERIQAFLAYQVHSSHVFRENRYPWLDRDLLEFVYGVPREQLVGTGERRSLMRRALRQLVPSEILDRKHKRSDGNMRKGNVQFLPGDLLDHIDPVLSSAFGIIDRRKFLQALSTLSGDQERLLWQARRIADLELWLRQLARNGIVKRNPAFRPSQDVFNTGTQARVNRSSVS